VIAAGKRQPKVFDTVRARNYRCYALGVQTSQGFRVRKVCWGRLMSECECRNGEEIRRALIMVEKTKKQKRIRAR